MSQKRDRQRASRRPVFEPPRLPREEAQEALKLCCLANLMHTITVNIVSRIGYATRTVALMMSLTVRAEA